MLHDTGVFQPSTEKYMRRPNLKLDKPEGADAEINSTSMHHYFTEGVDSWAFMHGPDDAWPGPNDDKNGYITRSNDSNGIKRARINNVDNQNGHYDNQLHSSNYPQNNGHHTTPQPIGTPYTGHPNIRNHPNGFPIVDALPVRAQQQLNQHHTTQPRNSHIHSGHYSYQYQHHQYHRNGYSHHDYYSNSSMPGPSHMTQQPIYDIFAPTTASGSIQTQINDQLDDIPDVEAYERKQREKLFDKNKMDIIDCSSEPTYSRNHSQEFQSPNHNYQPNNYASFTPNNVPASYQPPSTPSSNDIKPSITPVPRNMSNTSFDANFLQGQSPITSPSAPVKTSRASFNKPVELPPTLDKDFPGEDAEDNVVYPEPDLFDVKNTHITEMEMEGLRLGKKKADELRMKLEIPDANAPPNKIVESLMSFRTLKEGELLQVNSLRTKRNKLSYNWNKHNIDREFDQKACESLVKKLKDKKADLQHLIEVVVSKGAAFQGCITIPRTLDGRLQVHGRKGFPHVVYGKLWRFSEMTKNETRHVDHCKHAFEMKSDLVCVNPFHYELVMGNMVVGCKEVETATQPQRVIYFDNTRPKEAPMNVLNSPTQFPPNYQLPNMSNQYFPPHVTSSKPMTMMNPIPLSGQQPSTSAMHHGMAHSQRRAHGASHTRHQLPQNLNANVLPHHQQLFSPIPQLNMNVGGFNQGPSSSSGSSQPMFPSLMGEQNFNIDPSQFGASSSSSHQPQNVAYHQVKQEPEEGTSGNLVTLTQFQQYCKATFGTTFFEDDHALMADVEKRKTQNISNTTRETTTVSLLGVSDTRPAAVPLTLDEKRLIPPLSDHPEHFNWATIIYYEFDKKISEKAARKNDYYVDGGFLSTEYRYCLGLEPNPERDSASFKVRRVIIDGVRFTYQANGDVWIKNCMNWPVFITSGYLDEMSGGTSTDKVHKLYGHARVKVFGFDMCKEAIRDRIYSAHMASMWLRGRNNGMAPIYEQNPRENVISEAKLCTDSLQRFCCIQLSFVKGFGPAYEGKPHIKDTPCWIEVKINKAYDYMDQILTTVAHQLGPLNVRDFEMLGLDTSDD